MTIAKLASSTQVALVHSTIRHGTHGRLSITVTVPGVSAPTGGLRVYDGTRLLSSPTLSASNSGHKTVTLRLLGKGKHHIHVTYRGNSTIRSSKSASVTLTVT